MEADWVMEMEVSAYMQEVAYEEEVAYVSKEIALVHRTNLSASKLTLQTLLGLFVESRILLSTVRGTVLLTC